VVRGCACCRYIERHDDGESDEDTDEEHELGEKAAMDSIRTPSKPVLHRRASKDLLELHGAQGEHGGHLHHQLKRDMSSLEIHEVRAVLWEHYDDTHALFNYYAVRLTLALTNPLSLHASQAHHSPATHVT
jgi:hypothetical protein